MRTVLTLVFAALMGMFSHANAQWNNWPMPGQQNYPAPNMPRMPYGAGYASPRVAPQPQPFNMMPFAQQPAPAYRPAPAPAPSPVQPFAGMMPYSQPAPAYRPAPPPPQQPFGGMMPFSQPAPAYQPAPPPPAQPFGGMMPFAQPQPRYQAPPQQPMMMPGMDQGIRSMMQPGKIMAEEATPGWHVQPTWR